MTTTLHGLVTILSELFAGFNLINTGVVNCLIMCQNGRKMHHPEAKNPKKIPSPNPTPSVCLTAWRISKTKYPKVFKLSTGNVLGKLGYPKNGMVLGLGCSNYGVGSHPLSAF